MAIKKMKKKKIEIFIKEFLTRSKKKKFYLFIFLSMIFLLVGSLNAAQIFFDGFESGSLNGWDLTSAAGTWHANNTGIIGNGLPIGSWEMISSNSGTTVVYSQKNISTLGYNDIILIFYYKADTNLLDTGEYFTADWYDGSVWNNILNLTGDISTSYVLSNNALNSLANNNLNFKVRFSCKSNLGTEGCAIDNLTISGTAISDSTPPSINITYPQNISYNINVSNLNYTFIETNPGYCWHSLDSGITNSSVQACGINWTGLISNQGSNIWRVYANDTNGNLNWTDVTFFKDTINPQLSIIHPTNNTNTTNIYLNINYTRNDTNLGSCWWSENNGAANTTLVDCNNLTTQTWTEGIHDITIYVNDSANNINSSSVRFRIDTTGPLINIIYPESKIYDYNSSLALNYTLSDATGISSCWYNLNNGNNITIADCQNTTFNASDGNHVLYFYANDSLGNLGNSSKSFSISTTLAVNLEKPLNNAWIKYNNIELNYTVNTASQVYNCSLWTNSSGIWYLNQTNSSAVNSSGRINNFYVNLSDGSYIWNVECVAGVYDGFAIANYSLNIDSQNPVLNVFYPLNNSYFKQNASVLLNFSASDLNLQSCWYSLDNGLTNKIVNNCSNGINNLNFGYANGTYNLTVYANDSADNIVFFKIYNISIEQDSVAPNLTISSPKGTQISRIGISLQFSVSDNVDSLQELSCWYNITRTATETIEKFNTNIPCDQSTTFSVDLDNTEYVLFLTTKDRTGNIVIANSNFSVSTSTTSSVNPPSGGGGGGSSSNFSSKPAGKMEVSGIQEIVARQGDKKTQYLNIKNNGKVFLNNCRLVPEGDLKSWFYSNQIHGIAPGENLNFVFDLNVPEEISGGEYSGKIEVSCDELSKSVNIKISIPKELQSIKIKEIKQEKNKLNIKYAFESENIGKKVSIDIWLVDNYKEEITRIKDNFAIDKNSMDKEIIMELPEDLTGIYSIYFALSSDLDNFVKQSIVLGKSSAAGFAILDEPRNKMIAYVIFLLIIIAGVFFAVRKSMKPKIVEKANVYKKDFF